MAHKTLVGGTAYNISGGKSMVSGTAYNIKGGKTLVGGTGYNIGFGSGEPDGAAYAHLYSDKNFVFKRDDNVESGKTLTASYTGFEDVAYESQNDIPWNTQRSNIYNIRFNDEIAPISMANWFVRCTSLKSFNITNLNTKRLINMANAFSFCYGLNSSNLPFCGDNVINMSYAYNGCWVLAGSNPVCGSNVVNMYYAYSDCRIMRGSPVCGSKVTDMTYAYCNCYRLTGSPVCGDNVISMHYTYYNCRNLTGSPVCGEQVKLFSEAYSNCQNLTGRPVCGNNVTTLYRTYDNCYNLSGTAVVGEKVGYAYRAFYNCKNISGNAYFYAKTFVNRLAVQNCFGGRNVSNRLNIYVIAGSDVNTRVHYNNIYSLVGATITWTNAGSYQYNTAYNIYIYPVANVAAAAIANGDEEANANAGIITGGGHSGSSG